MVIHISCSSSSADTAVCAVSEKDLFQRSPSQCVYNSLFSDGQLAQTIESVLLQVVLQPTCQPLTPVEKRAERYRVTLPILLCVFLYCACSATCTSTIERTQVDRQNTTIFRIKSARTMAVSSIDFQLSVQHTKHLCMIARR